MTVETRQSYAVVSPLRSDGKRHRPGSTVALTAKEAAPLLDTRIVEGPLKDTPEDGFGGGSGTGTEGKTSAPAPAPAGAKPGAKAKGK